MMSLSQEKIVELLNDYRNRLKGIDAQFLQNVEGISGAVAKQTLTAFLKELRTFLANNGLRTQILSFPLELEDFILSTGYRQYIKSTYLPNLESLITKISKFPEMVSSDSEVGKAGLPKVDVSAPSGNKVFIVHRHDEANLYKLRDLLKERYKLKCIVMKWKPGMGRTLIEKFEQEAQDAGFAFIIMTPDDLIKIPGKEEEYSQARPNVIFEVGWFYGRLGRNRVCILFKKGTKIHSDLDGISRIEFNESVTEKVPEIENELRAAGLIK